MRNGKIKNRPKEFRLTMIPGIIVKEIFRSIFSQILRHKLKFEF